MADTYGHDEAMRDLELLSTNPAAQRNRVNRLTAYITRLEAADTRLLAAAEAYLASHPCPSENRPSGGPCHMEDELRAAIEQAKEGRS